MGLCRGLPSGSARVAAKEVPTLRGLILEDAISIEGKVLEKVSVSSSESALVSILGFPSSDCVVFVSDELE